jgi:predicted RNA binding protein YcfA (HicA-like mRNA interferase family)
MGGLFYWYLMRERGFSHAALAHSTHNATVLAIGKLLYKIFPPKK